MRSVLPLGRDQTWNYFLGGYFLGDGIALESIMKVTFKLTFLVRDWQLPTPFTPREKKKQSV